MPAVRFDLLGPPDLTVDGGPTDVDTRKAHAVLAVVLVDGAQRRDRLDALLWPESDAGRARAALRRTLKTLRRVLPDGWLAEGDDVALAGPVATDLADVEQLVGDGWASRDPAVLSAADALHRGELLAGLHFRDADPFEHWRRDTAERFARRHARVVELLCRVHIEAHRFGPAIEVAQRRLELDPLHEASHQQLMLLHSWRGDRAAAARQYATCVRVLDDELGVAPLPRTVALDRAVRTGTLEPPPPPTAAPVPAPPPRAREQGGVTTTVVAPLVGRDDQLAELLDLLAGCAAQGASVVVTGEPGIGRTRLAEAVAERATGRTLRLGAHPGEASLAYAPIAAALRGAADDVAALDGSVREELARLVPDVAGVDAPPAPLAGPGAQTRFVDALAVALLALVTADGAPGLLVLDDLDRMDPETQQVATYIVHRLAVEPVLVLATGRDGGLLPSADRRVSLTRLTSTDVAELAVVAGAADVADRLHAESEGVPFVVVSYLRAHTAGSGDWDLPADVRDLVRRRTDHLGAVAGQVLAAAAVLGAAHPVEVLERTAGRAEDEFVDAVEELVAEGLLQLDDDGTCGPTHDKIREVVLADTSPVRRRVLHRRAAAALRAGSVVDVAAVAHHLTAAGLQADAAEAHAEAGTEAAALYANERAAEHLEQALALGVADTAGVLLALGDVSVRTGAYEAARDQYVRAQARGAEPGLVEARLGSLALRGGDDVAATAHLLAALDAGLDDARRIEALAGLATLQARGGELRTARERAAEAVAVAAASDVGPGPTARAHNVAGLVARRAGDLAAARTHLRASLAATDGVEQRAAALNNLALALGEGGELDEALAVAAEALDAGRVSGDRHHEAALLNNLADLLHAAGRTPEALDLQRRAAERFAGVGHAATTTPEIWQLVDW